MEQIKELSEKEYRTHLKQIGLTKNEIDIVIENVERRRKS